MFNPFRHQDNYALISDSHIGTSMWQSAVLSGLGYNVIIDTLSDHSRYAGDYGFSTKNSSFARNLETLPNENVAHLFKRCYGFNTPSLAVCSFPPARFLALAKLPPSVKLILNVGHRLHIHVHSSKITSIAEEIVRICNERNAIFAAMSEYDYHYIKFHTGVTPLKLLCICSHLNSRLKASRSISPKPQSRTVLIGPAHNTSTILGFNSLDELNQLSTDYAFRHSFIPYEFRFIKDFYPNGATIDKLIDHPAVLLFPYSAFSISMAELYQANIPCFVPSDDFLVDNMNDVRLSPLYHSERDCQELSNTFPSPRNDYKFSPHSGTRQAQLYWMKYMYFNTVNHMQRWSSPSDLFDKLYTTDLKKLRSQMKFENQILIEQQTRHWKNLLNTNDETFN
jgi:hypothetical protein